MIDYKIVKYTPEFRNQILELQKHLWGSDVALNAAYFDWKYDQNPYLDLPLIHLALYEGKVAGMSGMFGIQWQVGSRSKTFINPCLADVVVAPDHRKKGLFSRMLLPGLDDLDNGGYRFNFVLSANKISYGKLLKLGWRDLGSVQEMMYKRGQRSGYTSILMKSLRFASTGLRHVTSAVSSEIPASFQVFDRNSKKRSLKMTPQLSAENVPRPAAMAELIQRIGTDGRMQQVRDHSYFAWRFLNPRSVYRFLFWEDNQLEGYLILRASIYKERAGVQIVDWEATSSHARADLLKAAIRWGSFHNLTIWSATLSEEAKTILQLHGFKLRPEPKSIADYRPSVLVRSVKDGTMESDWVVADRSLLELNNWDLRLIYSDGR